MIKAILLTASIFFSLITNLYSLELVEVPNTELPAIVPSGNLEDLKLGIQKEIEECKKSERKQFIKIKFLKGHTRKFSSQNWCIQTGTELQSILNQASNFEDAYSKIKASFKFFKSTGIDGKGTVQFTGYYSPLLNGSRTPTSAFNYPIYSTPQISNPKQGTPFPDRKSIDVDHALSGKNLEIVYVDNVFEAYIFHVQGAGSVLIQNADGSTQKIFLNYAASNGFPYVSLRKILLNQGVDPAYLTLQGMRKYFADHPSELMPALIQNPSYVFFKEQSFGPLGATNTVLTAQHSIAIDPSVFPLSSMSIFSTEKPIVKDGTVTGWEPFSRIAIANDIGGAIKGAGRVDVFWGEDTYAELAAGSMNQKGTLFFLLSKNLEP